MASERRKAGSMADNKTKPESVEKTPEKPAEKKSEEKTPAESSNT